MFLYAVQFLKEKEICPVNYLNSNLKEIEDNKKLVNTCKKCMELRLPEYNMGFNKHLWEEIAKKNPQPIYDYSCLLNKLIDKLELNIQDPKVGLPDEIFYMVSRLTPLVNVDLIIYSSENEILFTWRDDQYAGKGCISQVV